MTKSVDTAADMPARAKRGPGRPRKFVPGEAVDTPGIVPRSEGQRLLLAVPATLKSIAAACGVGYTSVIEWRYGRSMPSPACRAAMYAAYEIPAPSWSMLPAGVLTAERERMAGAPAPVPDVPGAAHGGGGNGHGYAAPPPPAPPTNGHGYAGPPNSLAETAALLAQIRHQLERPDLLANDRARITDTYTKTLALQHRLQKEADLTEDRIVREHPSWQRIRMELARVLARYPAVAGEVAEVLDRLGM